MNPPPTTALLVVPLVTLLFASGPGAIPSSAPADVEVVYQGQPVSHWIALLESEDVAVRRQAVAAMTAVVPGIDAIIPALGEAVEDEDQEVRLRAVEVLGILSRSLEEALPQLIRSFQSEDGMLRLAGLQALREIAEGRFTTRTVTITVPELVCVAIVPLLNDQVTETRAVAIKTLAVLMSSHRESVSVCADAGFPTLVEMLEDDNVDIRRLAVRTLGHFFPSSSPTRPVLLEALSDADATVRDEAAVALGRIQAEPGVIIPALVNALASESVKIRRGAVEGLRMSRYLVQYEDRFPDTVEADRQALLSGVITALNDPDPRVLDIAARLAGELGPLGRATVPALIAILELNGDPQPQLSAAIALQQIGPNAREAIPVLADALRNGGAIRSYAARALAAIDSTDTETVGPAFVEALLTWSPRRTAHDLGVVTGAIGPELASFIIESLGVELTAESVAARRTAAQALGHLGAKAADAVPMLVRALTDIDSTVRVASARALGTIGPDAIEAVPSLEQALKDDDHDVRLQAYDSLFKITPAEVDQIEGLVEMLRTGEAGARLGAARVLMKIGPKAGVAVPALIEALQDEDIRVRTSAASALGAIGEEAMTATAALVEAVRLDHTGLRQSIEMALYNICLGWSDRIPALLDALGDPQPEVRIFAISIIKRLGRRGLWAVPALGATLNDDHDAEVRWQAALVLARFGERTDAVLPVLLEALMKTAPQPSGERKQVPRGRVLRSSSRRSVYSVDGECSGELGRREAEALQALTSLLPGTAGLTEAYLQLLDHRNAGIRANAARGFGRVKAVSRAVIDGLFGTLHDDEACVRAAGAEAIGGIGRTAADAVGRLIELLADDAPAVRGAAVAALGQIGAEAAAAVPALMRAMKDPSKIVQAQALDALGEIGPASRPAIQMMTAALLSKSHGGDTIWKLGPEAVPAIPMLIEALHHENTRRAARSTLEQIRPGVEGAANPLGKALSDVESTVRIVAAKALHALGPSAESAVPALIEALGDPDEQVRKSALEALGGIGIQAGKAVPALVEIILSEEESAELRQSAGNTLWQLGPEAEAAVPILLNAITETPGNQAAGNALSGIRPVSPSVARYLIETLEHHPDARLRLHAAGALQRLGPAAREAVPALVSLLKGQVTNPDPYGNLRRANRGLRHSAITTLASIGPDARAAVPALVETLADPDTNIRIQAAWALGKIRVPDPAAISVLVEALRDPEQMVRSAALDALYQLGWEPEANPD